MRYVVLAHLNFEVDDPNGELDELKAADHVRKHLTTLFNENVILVETVEIKS